MLESRTLGAIVLAIEFLTPLVLLLVGLKVFSPRVPMMRLALASICLIWATHVAGAEIVDRLYESRLMSFDLDRDGSFSSEEATPEYEQAAQQFYGDTGRTFAPIVGLVIGFVWSVLVFGIAEMLIADRARAAAPHN